MPIVDVDVTTAGLIPAGDHQAIVAKLEYQVKSGEKWNQDGTQTVELEEWKKWGVDKKRLHYSLSIPGKGMLFHDLYVMPTALGFVKTFLKATGVSFTKEGFNPEEAVGRNIGISVIIKEDADYGDTNKIVKVFKS